MTLLCLIIPSLLQPLLTPEHSPAMEVHTVPTTTFGLRLEGIEMELAMVMDTDFMDVDGQREVHVLDADGDVHMD